MDFISRLPKTRKGHDSIWVIVDRLTKSAHFLPIRVSNSADDLARLYIREIIRLHKVPIDIVSDWDTWFTSIFWTRIQETIEVKLKFSTAFHPQTDGQVEQVNQVLEDILRACVLDFKDSWDDYLPYVEFAYNNSFQVSIGMAPYEALYGCPCQAPHCWAEVGEKRLIDPDLVQVTSENIEIIRRWLLTTQSRQKIYADTRRRRLDFEVGDHVFLKVSSMKGVIHFGKKGKLTPRFIGPFQILDRVGMVAYCLALPTPLAGVHNVFHISMLKKYVLDPSHIIKWEQVQLSEDATYVLWPTRILDRKEQLLRSKVIPLVKVL